MTLGRPFSGWIPSMSRAQTMTEQSVSECGENYLKIKRAWLENYICENVLEPLKEKRMKTEAKK